MKENKLPLETTMERKKRKRKKTLPFSLL